MKSVTYSIILLSGIFLAACQGTPETDIDVLKAKRDSLKEVKSNVSNEISDLEANIAMLDTSSEKRITVVTSLQLEPSNFSHYFTVQGNVETDQNAVIIPEVQGKITSIKVKEGQKVSKGDIILTVDSRVVQNNIDETKARLDLAEIVFKKQENLWNQNIGSEIQYLEAKNNRDALVQRMEALQAQLDMYNVRAPFSGVIDELRPKVGELANPMTPVARIINLDKVYLKCDVSESYLSKIGEGDQVSVYFPSTGQKLDTEISRIGKYINPQNRSFVIRLNIDNKDNLLMPNLLGEVKIRDYSMDSTAVLASSIIQQLPDNSDFVYVLEKNGSSYKTVRRSIKTGLSYDGRTHVTAGLKGTESIVVEGSRAIRDGETVLLAN
jgi:membrane fusion protein (multidrug efflux system)